VPKIPVLCLCGAFLSGALFTPLKTALAKDRAARFDVYHPTLLGHGDNATVDLDYAKQASWLGTRYAADRPVILGHSMGAGIALQCALQWPTPPRGLILCGAGLGVPTGPNTTAGFLARGITPALTDDFVTQMTKGWFQDRQHPAIDRLCAEILALTPDQFDVIRHSLAIGIDDPKKMLRHLAVPALIVHGRHDKNRSRSESAALVRLLGGDFVEFDSCGHMIPLEDPAAFAKTVSAWCGTAIPQTD
jgi:pimeloyl-ACP methyl ester carboxylesterase